MGTDDLEYNLIATGSNNGTYSVNIGSVSGGKVNIPAMHRPAFDVDVHVNNETWYSTYRAVTEIAANAFASSAITELDILPRTTTPKGTDIQLKAIGANAFQNCAQLVELTIPNVDIDSTAFTGSALRKVTIYKRDIPGSLFQNTATLQEVILMEGVTTIGALAFRNCTALAQLTIPSTVASIAVNAFEGCTGLRILTSYINIDTIFTSTHISFNNLRELHLLGTRVTGILNTHPFNNLTFLETVVLSPSVQNIGINAFNGCTSLATVTMPGVVNIRDSAFRGCTSLTTVTLPTSLRTIEQYAFENCTSLTAASLPNGVTTIGRNAFSGCGALADIAQTNNNVIPSTVTSIGIFAYAGTAITAVTLPNNQSFTVINDNTFNGCEDLTTVIFPAASRITRIGDNAFEGCESLGNLAIPLSVATIGIEAFKGCTGLGTVAVVDGSSSLRTISARAFDGCNGTGTTVIVPTTVTAVGVSAFNLFKGNLIILGKGTEATADRIWGWNEDTSVGWRAGIDAAANVQYL